MMRRLIACVGLVAVVGCDEAVEPPPPELRPVRVMEVSDVRAERTRSFAGTAKAGTESKLSFKVAGNLRQLTVKVGDTVEKGQLLARVDATDYELQVQEASAAMAQANAQRRNAEATFKRMRDLYANQTASRQDLDNAKAQRDSSRAAAYSVANRLKLARSQVAHTRLEAPVEGTISSISAAVNENVGAGQPVVVLSSGDALEVTVAVPEVLIARIKAGDKVRVKFDAIKDRYFDATVTEVGVSGSRSGATFPVIARLTEADDAIRAGMAAEVTFDFAAAEADESSVRVPAFSVGEDDAGRFVYVLEPGGDGSGTVKRQAVEIGDLTVDGLAVTSGLEPGALLVTAGVTRITDGMTVRVVERKAPAADETGGSKPAEPPADEEPAEDAP